MIAYETIEKHEDHVTGIAYYRNPDGYGDFKISVSGSETAIEVYAGEATIKELALVPIAKADLERSTYQQRAAAKFWLEQGNLMPPRIKPDWTRDRLIQIELASPTEKEELYWFTMTIDPPLNDPRVGADGSDAYYFFAGWSYPQASVGSIAAGESSWAGYRYVTIWETAGGFAYYTMFVDGRYLG